MYFKKLDRNDFGPWHRCFSVFFRVRKRDLWTKEETRSRLAARATLMRHYDRWAGIYDCRHTELLLRRVQSHEAHLCDVARFTIQHGYRTLSLVQIPYRCR